MDAVAVLPLPEGRDQAAGELRLRDDDGEELRRVAIEKVDPWIASLEEPLPEVDEAGEPGRSPAGEHLPALRRRRVLAGRLLAAQAEHPPGLEQGAVTEQRLHRLLEGGRGVPPERPQLALAERGRQGDLEIDLLAPSGYQMAQRMAVDPLAGLGDQELKGLADTFVTVIAVGAVKGGHGVLPLAGRECKRRTWLSIPIQATLRRRR